MTSGGVAEVDQAKHGIASLTSDVDAVIDQLDDIIVRARQERSRLGYFPALYRKVTVSARAALVTDVFDDPVRAQRLIVVFANRYLTALDEYHAGRLATGSWKLVFDASGHFWPIVLQHLLLGVNAHINVDLGIAAARTAPAGELPSIQSDFNKVNQLLFELVDDVQRRLATVWPGLRLLDRMAGRVDEWMANVTLRIARQQAWRFAEQLAPASLDKQTELIRVQDRHTVTFGKQILHPGLLLGTSFKVIRLGERGSVAEIIDLLSRDP